MRRALTLTALIAALMLVATAAFAGPGDDSSVDGGGNWAWSFDADSGTNYLQVNARDDKHGDSKGKIHWRQTRNDDQNYHNVVADVTCHDVVGDTAWLSGVTKDGLWVYVRIIDNGEPGAGNDQVNVVARGSEQTNSNHCNYPVRLDPATLENGNFQVRSNTGA